MATDRQIVANRDNAKLSTGPTSDAGKAASSRNHTTHGLTAKGLIIPPGLEDEFADHHDKLRNCLAPTGELQETIFARILECSWNLHRCRLAEHQLFETTAIDPLLDDANAGKYDRIQNYARRHESSLHKSLQALAGLQTEDAFRRQVHPITEATTQEELNASPHALSEVCSYVKVAASVQRLQPKSARSATDRYLESLISRHNLASNYKTPSPTGEDQ